MSLLPTDGDIVRATILRGIAEENAVAGGGGGSAAPSRQPETTAHPSIFNVRIPLKEGRCLAYNTLSGAFAVWTAADGDLYARAEKGELLLSDPRLGDFAEAGYLVEETPALQLEAFEHRYREVRFDPASLTLTIAPTSACNFSCDYCFQGLDKPNRKMSPEVQEAFIRFLAPKLATLKELNITWYGGEPLMALPVIRSLSRRMLILCNKARVRYSAFIVTNGWHFDRATAEELYQLRVTSAQVTFDGPAMYHDLRRPLSGGRPTYERIVTNLREVIDNLPIQVSVRVNIDARNKDQVRELLDDLAARGFGRRGHFRVYFAPVEAITEPCHACSQVDLGKQAYGRLEAELYRYAVERGLCGLPKPALFLGNCQAIRRNGLLLAPDGALHKCWDTMHDPALKVGTIFQPEKLEEDPLFRRWLEWSPFANPVCRSCKILPICTGFCAYKFVHPEKTRGETGSLPCPSWKFNFVERIVLRAEKRGLVRREEIDLAELVTGPEVLGASHRLGRFGGEEEGSFDF
ncbi:MAG: SPASM domain-containing protein [Magnetococcales bacterium]|nr:SPASM domain-containing protein [Magnetococcales bacterium]